MLDMNRHYFMYFIIGPRQIQGPYLSVNTSIFLFMM